MHLPGKGSWPSCCTLRNLGQPVRVPCLELFKTKVPAAEIAGGKFLWDIASFG